MSSFIHLSAKGDHKSAKVGDMTKGVEVMLGKFLKRTKDPQLIGTWTWQKYKLFLYGYKEGRSGTENKHEFPPPHDEVSLFGDACVIASLEKLADKPAPFTVELYKKFYNSKLGGFDDGDSKPVVASKLATAAAVTNSVLPVDGDDEEGEEDSTLDEDDDDDEEDYDDEEGIGEEDDTPDIEGDQEDDEEEAPRPVVRIKSSATFKKVARWMYLPELKEEPYLL